MKKGLDSDFVHNEKYLKTKIKSDEGKMSINFHSNKIPKKVLNVSVYQ